MIHPYYDDGSVVIYHGDCLEVLPLVQEEAAVLITDPPYGIRFRSGRNGRHGDCSVVNDDSTEARDAVLSQWSGPAAVFGTWRAARPPGLRTILVWDKGEGAGMGDLTFPWKPNWEEIYIFGNGWHGTRSTSVLSYPAMIERSHPTEKPLALMQHLVLRAPPGVILDPFMGSGTTLRAAKNLGRKAIGIEIEEGYCAIAARRMSQSVMAL